MTLYLNYVKSFKTLVILINNKDITSKKVDGDITILYNEDEILGFNIANVDLEISGWCTNNNDVFLLAEEKVKKYLNLENENQFVVAEILEIEDIPDTHLHKCLVNIGNENVQIVCGAKNARKGLITVCALVGAFMPNSKKIVSGKLRGIDSFGMLCSAKELEINKFNNEGIVELDNSFKIGANFFEVM